VLVALHELSAQQGCPAAVPQAWHVYMEPADEN
jgi:hypothetical protein